MLSKIQAAKFFGKQYLTLNLLPCEWLSLHYICCCRPYFLCFDIGEVPRSLGKFNWNRLSFLPFIFIFNQCVVHALQGYYMVSALDLSRVGTLFWIGATEEELAESRSHFTFSLEFLPTMLECQWPSRPYYVLLACYIPIKKACIFQ